MRELTQYAIIDGASEEALLNFLAEHNPPHSCLYAEPLQQELVAIAPYLVQVTDEVSEWLADKVTPWGIYVSTSATMKELRQHLRKYLQIIIPGEEKPVFFRFYDPRNVWDFCSVLSDWELHCFMGPVVEISTIYERVVKTENFKASREPFPPAAGNKMKLFRLNQTGLDSLNQIAEDKYILKLIEIAKKEYPTDKLAASQLYNKNYTNDDLESITKRVARESYSFCIAKGINDDRSIRGMVHLLMEKGYESVSLIPEQWRVWLSNEGLPGNYRLETLVKDELGYIPR